MSTRVVFLGWMLVAFLLLAAGTVPRCKDGTGGIGGGGGGDGGNPPPPPGPSWYKAVGGEYSYNEGCTDRIDPVTTVIRRNGAATADHVGHHGETALDVDVTDPLYGDGRQHFEDGEECPLGEVSQATNDGWKFCGLVPCAESRWHVRCNVVESAEDPEGGTWAACTPHWDQEEYTGDCWHYVPERFGDTWPGLDPDGSGFTAGRDYLYHVLVSEGGHEFLARYRYYNVLEMKQCKEKDGVFEWAGSDGWVNFIKG